MYFYYNYRMSTIYEKALDKHSEWPYESVFNSFDNGTEIVIVSNTFVTLKEMANYIDTAKQRNIPVTVYRMNNEFKNEHSVPDDVITKMKSNFVDYENEIIITNC